MTKHKNRSKINKEIKEEINSKNKDLLQKIKTWQEYPNLKRITCEKCHTEVAATVKGLKVLLECPKCGHTTKNIPKEVLQANFNKKLSVLLKNKQTNSHFINKLEKY
jgi:Zn ribbon nucleic-acid-binding protein